MAAFTWLIAVAGVVITIFALYLSQETPLPDLPQDAYWGPGEAKPLSTEVKPFKVNIPASKIEDLNKRLDAARIGHTDVEDTQFNDGFNVNTMKNVLKYWRNDYKWNKHQKKLNSLPQFVTNIDGIDLHFLHVKADKKASQKVLPLLLLHGWPGSVWEMYKLIPMLTDPKLTSDQDVVFDVICPSLPGYGFSSAARKTGMNPLAMGQVFVKLMQRLGHEEFYIQGGDWGSVIATAMAQMMPQHIRGAHLNMFMPPVMTARALLTTVGLKVCPYCLLDDADKPYAGLIQTNFPTLLRETGYMHLHATKPHTPAFALNDSPMGLAAYILEKFSTWTDKKNLDLKDGGMTKKFTMDELLTNVMIYWLNGNIGSSMRLYKEYFGNVQFLTETDGIPVSIPVGLACFPDDMAYVPRIQAAARYKNIIQHTVMPRGGHFAAMEEPELLVNDFRKFVSKNEEM